ncbi:hypothetical protein V7S43_015534 [Phytophthora oleae]|uniref:Galactokinase n=1 Tax=Phytophthora oleae TaxID=2107226 RepID=A0ABD3F1P8_9STRA
MDCMRFRVLPLPAAVFADDEASKKLLQVVETFEDRFGRPPVGVARSPGRVNLIGEHVDYEGYAVLPMAIEQSVYVAFSVITSNSGNEGLKTLNVINAQPQYKAVTMSIDQNEEEMIGKLEQEKSKWAKYVLCGVLGLRDDYPELFEGETKTLQMLVDGNIPAGCGLSSSSALVVATALAASSALQRSEQELLPRQELAELCCRAEHRVGTMGGGMDQAVACLAQRGVALHLDFSNVPAKSSPVNVPDATAGVTFVVANSMVVAEKAVDAATRYNKRVVECAIAAKMMAKNAEIDNWRKITRLVEVEKALQGRSHEAVRFGDLYNLAKCSCPMEEYSRAEIEAQLGEPINNLFTSSSLEAGIKLVLASATSFKLQQRVLHVWGEAERVKQFQRSCTLVATHTPDLAALQEQLVNLGVLMNGSHTSCKRFYECSCPELDDLVSAALSAGALGARLTGAGWGGCIVALVRKTEVTSFMDSILLNYYTKRGIPKTEALRAMFESAPASGADIFMVEQK